CQPLYHRSLLVAERDIHEHLLTFNIHDVAEGAVTSSREIESNSRLPDSKISDVQILQPGRQLRIDNVQFFPRSRRTNAEHRGQHQEQRPRRPRLWRTRDRIMHRRIVFATLNATE